METQTLLSRHNKFISAKNITILFVSSDDYLHASLEAILRLREKHVNSHLTRQRV